MSIGSGFMCLFGSLLAVVGIEYKMYGLLLVARFFFWLALYGLLVVQTVLVYSIFTGGQMVAAYSLIVFAMRFGGVIGYLCSGPVLAQFGLRGVMWISAISVFVAFLSTISFACLFRGTATAQAIRPLLEDKRRGSGGFTWSTLREVPSSCWAFIFSIAFLYSSVFTFESVGVDMLVVEYNYKPTAAGYFLSLLPGISLFSPIVSYISVGNLRPTLRNAAIGMCFVGLGHFINALSLDWCPPIAMFSLGTGFVFAVCCLWTALPTLVRASVPADRAKDVEGLVTGLTYGFLALFQFLSNVISGGLIDIFSYPAALLWFSFAAWTGVGFCVASLKWFTPIPGWTEGANEEPRGLPQDGQESGLASEMIPRGIVSVGEDGELITQNAARLELSRSLVEDHY